MFRYKLKSFDENLKLIKLNATIIFISVTKETKPKKILLNI
jgi:hypothetical protein